MAVLTGEDTSIGVPRSFEATQPKTPQTTPATPPVSATTMQAYENAYWNEIAGGADPKTSFGQDAFDKARDYLRWEHGDDVAAHAAQGFDQQFSAHTDYFQKVAQEQLKKINNAQTAANNPQLQRYDQMVWERVATGHVTLPTAIALADDSWGSGNGHDQARAEFAKNIQNLRMSESLANGGVTPSTPAAPAQHTNAVPVVAKLDTDKLKNLQTSLGVEATGAWNDVTQDKVQKFMAKVQGDPSYTGKPDLIFGNKSLIAAEAMKTGGKLDPEQSKEFLTALEGMNKDAHLTGRQLQASGYVHPNAGTVQMEIQLASSSKLNGLRAQEAPPPNTNLAGIDLSNAGRTLGIVPVDFNYGGHRPGVHRSMQPAVIPEDLAKNPAYQAAMGHAPEGAHVKVKDHDGMHIMEVKLPHGGGTSIYGVDNANGTAIATSKDSKVVINQGQVTSDQRADAKNHNNMTAIKTDPNLGKNPAQTTTDQAKAPPKSKFGGPGSTFT